MNRLTLKALLLDTIIFLKFGRHIAPNYKVAKQTLCKLAGQPKNLSAKQLLTLLGLVYKDNKLEAEFWQIVDKYGVSHFLN